jgi:hypothetical protein
MDQSRNPQEPRPGSSAATTDAEGDDTMMPHALQTDCRRVLERWAVQHFRTEVWETVLFHDPGTLPEPTIQRIEHDVLADAQDLVLTLPIDRLKDHRYVNCMISESISEVKDRLRKTAAHQAWETQRRRQW